MKIRIGIEGQRRTVLQRLDEIGAPIMVSANSLWRERTRRFSGWRSYTGRDVALDSGGFVAMKLYGRFRWTVPQYVDLARAMAPTWWAQMDFCCEPEIASNAASVRDRITSTAAHLRECEAIASGEGVTQPMPVLQGWRPADYCNGPLYDRSEIPALVGVGSVCRREVSGVLAIIEALDRALPLHVKLHLFGVKSLAIESILQWFPHRIASIDSMAWKVAVRWQVFHSGGGTTEALKAKTAGDWYLRQQERARLASQQPHFRL